MVIEALSSLPDDDDSDDPGAAAVNQISLDDLVKPADWPEEKNWGTLTIDASCTPADMICATSTWTFANRISWDPYNEGEDLIPQAKKYKLEHGCYPEQICADRIYITT